MQKKLLGEILIEMGLASREVVIECLNKQTEVYNKGADDAPLGKLLLKSGYITTKQLEAALARQSKYRMSN
ncbi:MAG: hypothetical protein ACYC27_21310 [Armatimonadota bacterium]